MSKRIDSASKQIRASASAIYRAFADREAMEIWLPPQGMTGMMLAFAFHEGGSYRMRLAYGEPHRATGKTSSNFDEVNVRFVRLVPNRCIEQAVTFDSDNPQFSGEMRLTWTLDAENGATLVTVRCEDVPEGIRPEDHEVGLKSTLDNLAAFVEGHGK